MSVVENSLKEVTWQEVRKSVAAVNPELARIVNAVNPTKKYKLIHASYQFGDYIIKHGELFLPMQKNLLALKSANASLQDQLGYSAIPLFLTLKNCNEVFIDTGNRISPLNLFYPGSLLGLFETLDFMFERKSLARWSVTAGSRSIFMLPKINRLDGLKQLRFAYGLSSNTKIQNLSDHWNVFQQIAKRPNFSQPWQQEVLFFTKEWFVHQKDPAWFPFYQYLFKHGFSQAKFSIDKIQQALDWESFVDVSTSRGLKPTPYLAAQVKHIILIASEKWPGFRPTADSQVAPIDGIQEAFLNVYQLKQHFPTIMHACLLRSESQLPVYYSLAFPTLLEGAPHNENSATLMLTLRDIKMYLTILSETSTQKNPIDFAYFHVEPDKYQEILSSKYIADSDLFFQQYANQEFCYTSPFWRGCIRISYKSSL